MIDNKNNNWNYINPLEGVDIGYSFNSYFSIVYAIWDYFTKESKFS